MTLANAPAAQQRLAIVTIGSLTVGVDVACVVQAIPMPAVLAPLPRRRGALAGVIESGGMQVPVADLGRWIEIGAAVGDGAARRILVLREGARTIGLLTDSIVGFADVPATGITRLHHDDDPDEVFQASALLPGTDTIVCILEVGRLVALASAWHDGAASAPPQPDMPVLVAPLAAAVPVLCAVLQVDAAVLALPAEKIAAVMPRPALERTGLGGSAFCRWSERHVPVVEVIPSSGGRALLAILEHDGALLGIQVDAALDMRPLLPPAPDASLATIYDDTGRAVDYIDVPALFARHPETALSLRAAVADQRASTHMTNEEAQLIFDAGGTKAIAISAVEHVLPFEGANDAASATMPWEGQAIALMDLRQVRGSGAVLVLRHDGKRVACVVERVRSIVPSGGAQVYTMAHPGQVERARFITVSADGGTASYRIVEPRAMVTA